MEFKGTKGDWKFNDVSMSGKPHYNVIGTALGGKFKIANVPWVDGDRADIEEALANAKLIAAAPELLEALQDMVSFFDKNVKYNKEDQHIYLNAKSAISKALTIK